MSNETRNELGDFLRARREASPVPITVQNEGRRRRTPGLRREEVAEAAGISVDWYTRLEQGRVGNPSLSTAEALARVLGLGDAERRHLIALVRPGPQHAQQPEVLDDSLQRIVHSLNQPAYITGRRWDLLAWNAAAATLFGDFASLPLARCNLLAYMFGDPRARQVFGDTWAQEARRMVGKFRSFYDHYAGQDSGFAELVTFLCDTDEVFVEWWAAHDIASTTPGRKLLSANGAPACWYEYATFQLSSDPTLRLALYSPL